MSESPAMRHLDVTLKILNILEQVTKYVLSLERRIEKLEAR